MVVVQLVEGVKKFLLCTLLVGEEMDVVDEQYVHVPVALAESGKAPFLDGVDVVVGEGFAGDVEDVGTRVFAQDGVCDGVEEVGFAEACGTVDEERVVLVSRVCGDGEGSGVRQFVFGGYNEVFKGVAVLNGRGPGRVVVCVAMRGRAVFVWSGGLGWLWSGVFILGEIQPVVDLAACGEGEFFAEQTGEVFVNPHRGKFRWRVKVQGVGFAAVAGDFLEKVLVDVLCESGSQFILRGAPEFLGGTALGHV